MAFPAVNTNIIDLSPATSNGTKGLTGLLVTTQRGRTNYPVLVSSWAQFQEKFGDIVDDTLGPVYAKRFFDAGGSAYVVRLSHDFGVSGNGESVATGSSTTVITPAIAEVLAKNTFSIAGSTGGQITQIAVNGVNQLSSPVAWSGTVASTIADVIDEANNNTVATPDYTFSSPAAGQIQIEALAGTGAGPNGFVVVVTFSGGITVNFVPLTGNTLAGGVTAVPAVTATNSFAAKDVGSWANTVSGESGLVAVIALPRSGDADKVDITVHLLESPQYSKTYYDVPKSPTATQIAQFNASADFIDIVSINYPMAPATITFAGGAQDRTLIDVNDAIGSSTLRSGMFALDGKTDMWRFIAPEMSGNVWDLAAVAYCAQRGDCRVILRTPLQIDGDTMLEYREQTGAYSGTAVNSMYAAMTTSGGIRVIHPLTEVEEYISEIADVAGLASLRDQKSYPFFAKGRKDYGFLFNVLGVWYNLGESSKAAEADLLVSRGLMPVADSGGDGPRISGNRSLHKTLQLTKFDHICELILYIKRGIQPILRAAMLEPNSPQTWRQIYAGVKVFMKGIQDAGGVIPDQEPLGWKWEGDQDAENTQSVVVNNPNDLTNGIYKCRLFFVPVGAIETINLDIVVTSASLTFNQ